VSRQSRSGRHSKRKFVERPNILPTQRYTSCWDLIFSPSRRVRQRSSQCPWNQQKYPNPRAAALEALLRRLAARIKEEADQMAIYQAKFEAGMRAAQVKQDELANAAQEAKDVKWRQKEQVRYSRNWLTAWWRAYCQTHRRRRTTHQERPSSCRCAVPSSVRNWILNPNRAPARPVPGP
jgi:hypothetical protein